MASPSISATRLREQSDEAREAAVRQQRRAGRLDPDNGTDDGT